MTDPTLRIVAGCKNILDKCIDVKTNLSVDTLEFRESSGQHLRSISRTILCSDSRWLQTTRGIVVIVVGQNIYNKKRKRIRRIRAGDCPFSTER